ncbi:MAG: DNA gyrase inhibitor YacG [Proteobacteria bacterium]|nr:DNA gyrase inhibitor YacG [Pseudomonadota bacterium]HQR03925.1 DNA gyrase inhibitor YacG [Rhodocyclaceae bacterium]
MDRPSPRIVRCPHCGVAVKWEAASRFRPFCSERCRQIDLGAWASEDYRLPENDEGAPQDASP